MRARSIWAVVFLATATGAGSAAEMLPEFEDVIRHCPAGLCTEAAVQRELKVSDVQIAKLAAVLKPIAEDYAKALPGLPKDNPEVAKAALDKLADSTRVRAMAAAVAVLDAKQAARLRQIDLQERGPGAFEDESVRKALAFTEAQLKKLSALKGEYENKVRRFKRESSGAGSVKLVPDTELPQAGQDLLTGKTYPMLKKEYALAAKNVLTNDQREKWYDLIGDIYPNPVPPKK